MYTVEFNLRFRFPAPENAQGFSWRKQENVVISGDTVEEVMDRAHNTPVPDDLDIEALHLEGTIKLGQSISSRKTLRLDVFKEISIVKREYKKEDAANA